MPGAAIPSHFNLQCLEEAEPWCSTESACPEPCRAPAWCETTSNDPYHKLLGATTVSHPYPHTHTCKPDTLAPESTRNYPRRISFLLRSNVAVSYTHLTLPTILLV
eukprot:5442535-Amphidinium_carterae.1